MFIKLTGFVYKDFTSEGDIIDSPIITLYVSIQNIIFIQNVENSEMYRLLKEINHLSYIDGDDENYNDSLIFLEKTKGKTHIKLPDHYNVIVVSHTFEEMVVELEKIKSKLDLKNFYIAGKN